MDISGMQTDDVVPRTICGICARRNSQYNCPRCNVEYCSVTCYRSRQHEQCSEAFYKDQVMAQLHGKTCSHEEKQELLNILERQQLGNEEEDDDDDIQSRLAHLDLNDTERVWSALTESEREEFQRSLKREEISYIEVWLPWWIGNNANLVKEIETGPPPMSNSDAKKPSLLPLQHASTIEDLLHGKPVHLLVSWKVVDVLLAYLFAARLYNGEHQELCGEFCETVLQLSSSLTSQENPESLHYCLRSFVGKVRCSPMLSNCIDPVEMTLNDLALVLRPCSCCPCLMHHALCDLHAAFQTARDAGKRVRMEKSLQKSIGLACRKLDFLLAFVKSHLDLIGGHDYILAVRTEMQNEQKKLNEEKEMIENNLNSLSPKCLIEEIGSRR